MQAKHHVTVMQGLCSDLPVLARSCMYDGRVLVDGAALGYESAVNKKSMIGQRLRVRVEGTDLNGESLARHDGVELRFTGAFAGEKIELEIEQVSRQHARAWGRVVGISQKSAQRRISPCVHHPNCSGCPLIELNEQAQAQSKLAALKTVLGDLVPAELLPQSCVQTEPALAYRRRAKFVVFRRQGQLCFGAYQRRSHDPIETASCQVVSSAIQAALPLLQKVLNAQQVPLDDVNAVGLRYIQLRSNVAGDLLLTLVVRRYDDFLPALALALAAKIPALQGVNADINNDEGDRILSGQSRQLWGQATISEHIAGQNIQVDAYAFTQIHGPAGDRLAQAVADLVDVKAHEWVADLYAGMGQMAFAVARRQLRVVAVETAWTAVQQGQQAARKSGLAVQFVCADSAAWAHSIADRLNKPTAVIVDPPRRGLGKVGRKALLALRPQQIIYVSCHAKSLQRDLRILLAQGYQLVAMQAHEIFPQTAAIETVVKLSREDLA